MSVTSRKTIQFQDWTCVIRILKYDDGGGPVIKLYDARTNETVATATINPLSLDIMSLNDNEVIIKDYSENEGMLETLVNAGIVEDTGIRIPLPYCDVPLCRLLVKKEDLS